MPLNLRDYCFWIANQDECNQIKIAHHTDTEALPTTTLHIAKLPMIMSASIISTQSAAKSFSLGPKNQVPCEDMLEHMLMGPLPTLLCTYILMAMYMTNWPRRQCIHQHA